MSEIEIVKEIKKLPRGRPIKIKPLEIINPELIEPIQIKNEIQKIPRGRPKKFDLTVHEYNQLYYLNNKEKTKGTCLCEVCNVLISKSNKSKHLKSKYHKKIIDFYINDVNEDKENYDEMDAYDEYIKKCEGETDGED